MAMASRLASNLTDDYFTCIICCNLYVDPRQTPCEHTFCFKCLADYGSRCRGKEFVCPICRTLTEIADDRSILDWIGELPADRFLLALMDTVDSYQSLHIDEAVGEDIQSVNSTSTSKMCPKHEGRELGIYCNDHSIRICFECAWQKHASCDCISLKDGTVEHRLSKTKDMISRKLDEAKTIQRRQDYFHEKFNKDKDRTFKQIENLQRRLQIFWGNMQINIQEKFQKIHSLSKDLSNTKSLIESLVLNLENLQDRICTSAKQQTADQIACLNDTEEELEETEDLLVQLKEYPIKHSVEFCPNSNLLRLIDTSTDIGTLLYQSEQSDTFCDGETLPKSLQREHQFKSESTILEPEQKVKEHSISNEFENSSSRPDKSVITKRPRNSAQTEKTRSPRDLQRSLSSDYVKVTKSGNEGLDVDGASVDSVTQRLAPSQTSSAQKMILHHSVITRENKRETSTLSGISIVENHVIIVDQYNNCILKVDRESRECTDKISIQEPHKVSLIPRTADVLLTCWDQSKIFVITTEPKLQIIDEIQTERHYLGVSAIDHNRILATATDCAIDVISFKGHVLISIKPVPLGVLSKFLSGQCVSLPADVGLIGHGSIVVHDGMKKSLLCMNLAGKVKWCRKISGLSAMRCYRNAIYISVGKSNVVMKLDTEGKILDPNFLSSDLGIRHPWALDLCGNVVVVTEDSPSSRFHICKLLS